tara:strand:- start:3089 stop:4345 length:1257 start_codon:yes stop_codon:yes gene_type:complete
MKILLKQAKIIDPSSSFNNEQKDILIEKGQIVEIKDQIKEDKKYTIIQSSDLHVSKGWIDLKAHFCDPGQEYKETLESGLEKAAKGGFTRVGVLPSTTPVMDQRISIDSLYRKAAKNLTGVIPMGCLSKQMEGKELAELYDMQIAGAALFTDDRLSTDAAVLSNALMYAQNFEGKIVVSLGNSSLSKNIQVNEGEASLKTGLKGDPIISEIIEIERHLRVLEYSGGSLHISGVSTQHGATLIAKAKKKGLSVTAEAHVMNLCFDESEVLEFNTRFKTLPPLRNKKDTKSLVKSLSEGAIDCVVSNHRPTDEDEKEVDFENATFGAPHVQTLFSAMNTNTQLKLNELISILSDRPANIIGITTRPIEKNSVADITIFDPNENFDASTLSSKDKKYSPFDLSKLKGKVIGVVRDGKFNMN